MQQSRADRAKPACWDKNNRIISQMYSVNEALSQQTPANEALIGK